MEKYIDYLFNKATIKRIILGISLIIFINLVVFPYFPHWFGIHLPAKSSLDLQFGFENGYVRRLLNILGSKGRKVYFYFTLFIDIPYLFLYGFTFSLLFAYLIKRKKPSRFFNFILFFPLFISLFDLLENTGIIYLMKNPYSYNEKWVPYISIANQLKWIFSLLTLGVLIGLLLLKKEKS